MATSTKTSLKKKNPRYFKLYRAYSSSFKSSNVGYLFMELNSKRLFQSSGEEKESRCLRSRPRQNVKLGTYTRCSRAATAKKCTKKRDVRAKLLSW